MWADDKLNAFPVCPRAALLDSVTRVGERIAGASADYVVDLLCGCGCRHYQVLTFTNKKLIISTKVKFLNLWFH